MDEHKEREATYIDREAAIKAANEGADIWDGGSNKGRYKHISDALNAVPAADVQPVKLAHWDFTYGYPRCSYCHAYLSNDEYENHTMKFCYYCGAKMGKDGDGE